MPPKPKNTKEELLNAALHIFRTEGANALTARKVGALLNTAPSSVFTHFSSMDDYYNQALSYAENVFDVYIKRGLEMTPPFKGCGIEIIHFAKDEPNLFNIIFLTKHKNEKTDNYIMPSKYKNKVILSACETFNITEDVANRLYSHLWIYTLGIATLIFKGVYDFSDAELSKMLGECCKGLLMMLTSKDDSRTEIVPEKNKQFSENIKTYF